MTTHVEHRTVAGAIGLAALALLAGCSAASSSSSTATGISSTPGSSHHSALSASASTRPTDLPSTTTAGTIAEGGTACALVTEHDAAIALGTDPGPGSAFSSHGSTQCQYGSYQTQFLLVNLTPARGQAGYDLMHSRRAAGQHVSTVDIAGVGDRAFEVTAPHTAGIYANKGDAMVVVTMTRQAVPAPPTVPVLALAKLAASRL